MESVRTGVVFSCLFSSIFFVRFVQAEGPVTTQPVVVRECLVIENPIRARRAAVHVDAIEAQIVAGTWKPPGEGERVQMSKDDTREWKKIAANKDGWFEDDALGGGYAYIRRDSDAERVMILEAMGHTMVYVNGEPRAGDPYSNGAMNIPVLIKKGRNDLLFLVGRGRLRVELKTPLDNLIIDPRDATLPDFVAGIDALSPAAVSVVNATVQPMTRVNVAVDSNFPPESVIEFRIPPLSVRKIAFETRKAHVEGGKLRVVASGRRPQTRPEIPAPPDAQFDVRTRDAGQSYRRTL